MKETVLDSHLSLFEMLYLQQIIEQLLYCVGNTIQGTPYANTSLPPKGRVLTAVKF